MLSSFPVSSYLILLAPREAGTNIILSEDRWGVISSVCVWAWGRGCGEVMRAKSKHLWDTFLTFRVNIFLLTTLFNYYSKYYFGGDDKSALFTDTCFVKREEGKNVLCFRQTPRYCREQAKWKQLLASFALGSDHGLFAGLGGLLKCPGIVQLLKPGNLRPNLSDWPLQMSSLKFSSKLVEKRFAALLKSGERHRLDQAGGRRFLLLKF